MNYMLMTESVWRPSQAEKLMKSELDYILEKKGMITCPGCKPRAGHGEQEESLEPEAPECTSVDNANALDVLNAVCIAYGVAISDIQGSAQSGKVTAARRHAIWFLSNYRGSSAPEAGNEVGRDSKSARQAIALVEEIRRGRFFRQTAEAFTKLDDEVVKLLGGKRGSARG